MKRALLILCCALLPAAALAAKDAIHMEGTTIIGNRELPKVLYIVPWKQARPGEMVVRPFSTLYDQALAPVDRAVLRRQINYFKALEKTTTHMQTSKE